MAKFLVIFLTIALCNHRSLVSGQTGDGPDIYEPADVERGIDDGVDNDSDVTNNVGGTNDVGSGLLLGGGKDSKHTTTEKPCLKSMASCSWDSECCSNMCKKNPNAGYRCM